MHKLILALIVSVLFIAQASSSNTIRFMVGEWEPRSGDLLFHLATGDIPHVGVLIKSVQEETSFSVLSDCDVIEAIPAGVVCTSINEKIRSYYLAVARLKDETVIPEALTWLHQQLGEPYNSSFDWEGEGFYCSQLVAKALGDLFQPTPMTFTDPCWEGREYLPTGELGISPKEIWASEHVVRLASSCRAFRVNDTETYW
jgi:hypothetical protein